MTHILTDEVVEIACCAEHGKDWRFYYDEKDCSKLFEATRRALLAALPHIGEACAKVALAEYEKPRNAGESIAVAIRDATKET
jgi:hypothetical protein